MKRKYLAEERAIQAMLRGVQGAETEIAAAQQAEESLRLQQAKQQIEDLNSSS